MEFVAVATKQPGRGTDCAVVGIYDSGVLSEAAVALDKRVAGAIHRVTSRGDFQGKGGESLLLTETRGTRVLLVGLGSRKGFNRRAYRRAITVMTQALARTAVKSAVVYLSQEAVPDLDLYYRARFIAEGVLSSQYRIPDMKSARRPSAPRLQKLVLPVTSRAEQKLAQQGLSDGDGIAAGMLLTRDLGNLPANVCTPTYLANTARQLARAHRSLKVRVLSLPEIKRLKMGAFLSVTRGSDEPPRLIVFEYRGAPRSQAPIALIGKGITFDTGGISLKDPGGMDEMKFDMGGAATVFGVIKALAALRVPINVVGIVPSCENMPSGRATKPGDIVRSMSGQTIEVLNTDAEGRLILCDAITYSRRFRPSRVIDIATLTGACVIALGAHHSGLMSNDDSLAAELEAASRRADDRAWRLPIGEEYAEQLKSNFADLANVGGREGGALTAGSFLWKFADGLKWAHLDIAGTAWLSGAAKGSTGRPVPLLMDYLLRQV